MCLCERNTSAASGITVELKICNKDSIEEFPGGKKSNKQVFFDLLWAKISLKENNSGTKIPSKMGHIYQC